VDQETVDAFVRGYLDEKSAAQETTRRLVRARAHRVSYKRLALELAERLPGDSTSVLGRAEKLEVALRQRVAQHRRRPGVIADHDWTLDHAVRLAVSEEQEDSMPERFLRRRRVIDEVFLPPGAPATDLDDVEDLNELGDHDLDRCGNPQLGDTPEDE
jgi:hypothetical protein